MMPLRGLLVALLLLALSAQAQNKAKPHDFWKLDSERAAEITTSTFSAKKAPAKGQGLLMCAVWPKAQAEVPAIQPTEVLASLYSDLKEFQLLGSKDVTWGDQPARLMAFKATVNKRPVVGRCLIAQVSTGTEAILLVTNHDMQAEFKKEFERLQKHWQFGQPAAASVLHATP
jgi:hypothetical protein